MDEELAVGKENMYLPKRKDSRKNNIAVMILNYYNNDILWCDYLVATKSNKIDTTDF